MSEVLGVTLTIIETAVKSCIKNFSLKLSYLFLHICNHYNNMTLVPYIITVKKFLAFLIRNNAYVTVLEKTRHPPQNEIFQYSVF